MACPPGTYYILSNFTCYHPPHVSNISALNASHAVLSYKNVTLASVAAKIKADPYPVIVCPETLPLFNGTECVYCPNGSFYLLYNNTCYIPQNVSNLTSILNSGNYVNIANYTLVNMNAQIIASKYPVAHCPGNKPLWNGTECIQCPNGTYYLFLNLTCYTPHHATNITAI